MRRIPGSIIVLSLVIGLSWSPAGAISQYGGNGLVHVSSANNVYRGDLWATFQTSYNQGGFSLGTYKNARGSISLLYGILYSVELGINQVFYQDTALHNEPGTGPLRVSLKVGIPTSTPQSINMAIQLLGLVPVGNKNNVELESYYSDKPSGGGQLILSYDTNPVDLRNSKRFHLNLGYFYHNDATSYNNPPGSPATQQFLFGMAVQVPRGPATLFTEVSGEHFLKVNPFAQPATGNANGNDYIRLTPGLRYQFGKMTFQGALDMKLYNNGNYRSEGEDVPIYPRWKIFAGLEYRLREGPPPTYRRGRGIRIPGLFYYGRTPTRRQNMVQDLEERQQRIEEAERDLQAIRDQRIQAQRELEELRKLIGTTPQ